MSTTKIEWATHTWNPVTGCTKVSEGCRNCYAERMVKRFGGTIHGFDSDGESSEFGRVICHPKKLDQPLHWRKPRRVFVCSMSDLFHPNVPDLFICEVLDRVQACPQHTFMVLTKRPQRMSRWPIEGRDGPIRNLWLGVSVENQATADERIPLLLQTPAAVRFVSCEPMLGPVALTRMNLDGLSLNALKGTGTYTVSGPGLDWVICGGESGPGARPMHPDWARLLRDQCQAAGVPFFFKQWGEWASPFRAGEVLGEYQISGQANGRKPFCPGCAVHKWGENDWAWRIGKKAAGRELDGRTWDEFPQSAPGELLPGVAE